MNDWLHKKLNENAGQVDEDFDLPYDLVVASWLLGIIDKNNITITEKQWIDYNREVLGDEYFERDEESK